MPNLDKPLQETPIINQGAPLTKVPIHVLQGINTQARFTTKKDDYTFRLCRNKSKKKHITTSNSTPFRKFICIYNRLDHSTFFQSFQFHNQRKIIINTTKQCQKQQLLLPNKLHATVWPPSQLTCFPPTPPPPPRSSAPTASPPPPDPLRR